MKARGRRQRYIRRRADITTRRYRQPQRTAERPGRSRNHLRVLNGFAPRKPRRPCTYGLSARARVRRQLATADRHLCFQLGIYVSYGWNMDGPCDSQLEGAGRRSSQKLRRILLLLAWRPVQPVDLGGLYPCQTGLKWSIRVFLVVSRTTLPLELSKMR